MHTRQTGTAGMRRLFTVDEASRHGLTRAALRWGEQTGRWRRIDRSVYGVGADAATPLDAARAAVLAAGGVAGGRLAGVLLGLDAVDVRGPDISVPRGRNGRRPGVRRRDVAPERIIVVGGVPCTDGVRTMLDLAAELDDLRWG